MKKRLIGLVVLAFSLGLAACGSGSKTPYIGENGNWWIGSSDLGTPAQGPQGSQGIQGNPGKDGTSVTVVSIEKTKTEGLVDTYTITFSDGTKSSFTVTNAEANSIVSIEIKKYNRFSRYLYN